MRPEILTIPEVAEDLRCSKAHVYNIVNGKVPGVRRLPVIVLGRRKLARIMQCAVKRRRFSVGAKPTRQLSLQPVAIGAVEEATNLLKPLV